jgi:holo-[acyl-carrier protein] synthase
MADSIGIDIVEVARIEADLEKFGEKFVERILGPDEISRLAERQDRALFVSGRFAAKEAVIKALGAYLDDRPPYKDLQIIADNTGQPSLELPPDLAEQLAGIEILVSISHERNYAVAMATCSEKK